MTVYSALSILLVDDEPFVLTAMRRQLRRLTARVRLAASAAEALASMGAEQPDLLISDYRMPGMNGLELLERVRREHPEVRCVLHTAEFGVALPAGGGIDLLPKPCDFEALQALVQRPRDFTQAPLTL